MHLRAGSLRNAVTPYRLSGLLQCWAGRAASAAVRRAERDAADWSARLGAFWLAF